ncbi:antibiotic ABC transporter [Paracoccus gahaiensis]|nr:antibiotic ABC transporter [Paracoccus gahaiensis]
MNPMILPAAQIRLVTQFSRMAIEAQMVIGMRMAGMMGLVAQAPGEPFRMIAEKQAAASEAIYAMASAGMRGHSTERMLSAGLRPYGRRTRANSRRLTLVK